MKINSSILAAVCAIPSASAQLRGGSASTTTAAAADTTSSEVAPITADNNIDPQHRQLPYDSSGNWYWNYEGYTPTNSGSYEDGFCYYAQNDLFVSPLYDSLLECCDAQFGDQTSGKCISMLPDEMTPSAMPSITGGGIANTYAAVRANGYEGGYCSNLKADIEGKTDNELYDSELECCTEAFPNQLSGMCISMLPDANQPSAMPSITEGGIAGKYAAVYANGQEGGYCSNLKADIAGKTDNELYDSELECCMDAFADQTSGMCISMLPDEKQPSAMPSISEGGIAGKYAAVFANGQEGGYCSNLKADIAGKTDNELYDSELECCMDAFADQTSGMCISMLPDEKQPSAMPSITDGGIAGKYAAVFTNGYEGGYCSNLKADIAGKTDNELYDSEFECCTEVFPDQTSGMCISMLPDEKQPSAMPSITDGGIAGKYAAVFTNGYEGGYCSNLKADIAGKTDNELYESEFECCTEVFADQTSGMCISMLPDEKQPSAMPSITDGGIAGKYAAVYANGQEDGYCSNLKADIAGKTDNELYDSELECCMDAFADQTSGMCISMLPDGNQPSAMPSITDGGIAGKYAAVFANGYEGGYCSNLKADIAGKTDNELYDSEFECCTEVFPDQTSGMCISMLPDDKQPSAMPSITDGGIAGKYAAVFTNGYEGGYCSNLKADIAGKTDNELYESEFECCTEVFADQTSGMCISMLPDEKQPSAMPSITDGGIAGKYAAVYANGQEDGYCSNLKADIAGKTDNELYDSELECCMDAFADQTSGMCISMLPDGNQPSAMPSITDGGIAGKYAAVFTNGYEGGYCSNLKADIAGKTDNELYESEFECCTEVFADQTSGMCISMLPDDKQPSAMPSITDGGIAGKYAAVYANGQEGGYCSNLKADIAGKTDNELYDSELECCMDAFADQTSGMCISMLPDGNQPSAMPSITDGGIAGKYAAVFANGYEGGYCSNLKADIAGKTDNELYDSELECCTENFADQTSGMCISMLPDDKQPSAMPSLAWNGMGGLDVWVPVWTNSYEGGYCSNKKADVESAWGDPFEDPFECCEFWFGLQGDEKNCLTTLIDYGAGAYIQPSAMPSITDGGIAGVFAAVFANGYEGGYCSNLKADIAGKTDNELYDSELECCTANFADQTSGMCISMLPDANQPSAMPSITDGGIAGKYAAVFTNGYEGGYCSNLKADIAGKTDNELFDSELECCTENFADQTSGMCISMLPDDKQPSAMPSLAWNGMGGLDVWVPVWTNSYEGGYCSNKKADVESAWGDPFEDPFECCEFWFGLQGDEKNCLTTLIDYGAGAYIQPSAMPSITDGGIAGVFAAVFANGYEGGYCSNLKADIAGKTDNELYDSELECCTANFADQTSGMCISMLPDGNQPSAMPSITDGGIAGKYAAVFTNGYEGGYCSNLKADIEGRTDAELFDSELECCTENFADQTSGMCISMLPDGLQPSSAPSLTGGCLLNAKFFPRFPGVGNPPATENYCDDDHRDLPQWQLDNYDTMGFDTLAECCESWFPEMGTDCSYRTPTCGVAPVLPTSCPYYPDYGATYELGTCLNDCNHPTYFEDGSNLLFEDSKAGGIECCNEWFENNGLTQQQIGSGRLSYCIEQLAAANPSYGITAPPTRAPVG